MDDETQPAEYLFEDAPAGEEQPADDVAAQDETPADDAPADEQQADDGDQITIEFDGQALPSEETAPADETERKSWAAQVRQENRRLAKELAELKAKHAAAPQQAADEAEDPGPRPELEQFEFDSEKYVPALEKWLAAKNKAEAKLQEKQREAEAQAQAWQAKLKRYEDGKKELKFTDFADVELTLNERLNETQRGIIVHAAANPALFAYAIGKSQKALDELVAEKDPILFAAKLGKYQEMIKAKTTRKAPPPESKPSGGSVSPKSSQATLENLRAQAEKTGDRTKVVQFMKSQQRKA